MCHNINVYFHVMDTVFINYVLDIYTHKYTFIPKIF